MPPSFFAKFHKESLKGKVIIVTGVSSGIGRGCAELLNKNGATVVGFDINPEHSGFEARITQLEKNDADISKRLRELEIAVWKAAGASGVVTAVLVVLLERMIK